MTDAVPLGTDEHNRLKRLRSLEILDTSAEPVFDALTRLASSICDTPVALLCLVDAHRQWFKSNLGLEGTTQTPREWAFCAHTIKQTTLLEVPDAMLDPRFVSNPLVTGLPHIRFYAGVPIVMPEGEQVGTLCVIDRQPRLLTSLQRATLLDLAQLASNALQMRQQARELDRLTQIELRTKQEIINKDALYQSIVEDQSDLISLSLPTGELTFVNRAYAQHFGEAPQAMLGHNLLEFVLRKDRDKVADYLRTLCRQPGTGQSENQMQSANGEPRWMAWSNRAIGNAQGKVVMLHSVGRDITERKRSEFALKASQDRIRSFYESTPAMLQSLDLHGRILFVSDAWLEKLGYVRQEVVGRLSNAFLTPHSSAYATTIVEPDFFQRGRCDGIKYQMLRQDGTIMDVLFSAVLERDAQGAPAHSLAVVQDVTEKNAMSDALRIKEERLALATSVNEIGIWEVDLITGRLAWDDTMFRIFDADRATFGGTVEDWSSKLHPDDFMRSTQAFQNAIDSHQPLDFDFRVVRRDGQIRYVNTRAIVIKDAQGKGVRVVGTNYDVSERKRIERARAHSEQHLRLIANNLPILISYIDADFRYTFANNKYQEWYGVDEKDMLGKHVAEVFGESVFAGIKPHLMEGLAGKEVCIHMSNSIPNERTNLTMHYIPDRDERGEVIGIFGMVLDRTEAHEAQASLEANERQLRAVTDNLPVLIAYIDTQQRLRFINETFHQWLHIDLEWAIGRHFLEVFGATLYEQRSAYLQRALHGERIEFESELLVHGMLRHVHTTYLPDIRKDGVIYGIFALGTDVTALKRVEQGLRDLTRIDILTGLPNRRELHERLTQAIMRSRRSGHAMALMFLDIDHFKSINDSAGHGFGDQVLCEFANRIQAGIRVTDMAARLAGDEFVILLEDVGALGEIEEIAVKLLEAVRHPMMIADACIEVSTSIGIACNTAQAITPDELIAHADKALYRAKANGRNTFSLYGK